MSTESSNMASEKRNYMQYVTDKGNNRLHIAARFGYEELVQEILNRCPSLLFRQNKRGDNPLHVAAKAGHLRIVQLLTKSYQGIAHDNIMIKILTKLIPQHLSLSSRSTESTKDRSTSSKLPLMPPWRTQNQDGNTALHEALRSKHEDVALHLLDMDSEQLVLVANAKHESPLYLAAKAGFVRVLIKILFAGGGNQVDGPNNQTPLHAAVLAKSAGCIEVLHDWIPELLEKEDSYGKKALDYATPEDSPKIKRLLEKLGDTSSASIFDDEDLSPPSNACPASIQSKGNSVGNEVQQISDKKGLNLFELLLLLPIGVNINQDNIAKILTEQMSGFSVVAGLIATITFTAAFTIPGGYKADGLDVGSPLLIHKTALKVFLLSDTVAFFCSIMAVFSFTLSAKTNEEGRTNFSLFVRVFMLLGYSLDAAMIAFISGLYAVMSIESKRLASAVCVIGCSIYFLVQFWNIVDVMRGTMRSIKPLLNIIFSITEPAIQKRETGGASDRGSAV